MGKLNIAHHKSYHPYRRDNIERVRRDEEEAKLKESQQEGKMMLADSEARIAKLREQAGASKKPNKRRQDEADMAMIANSSSASYLPTSNGHINLFEDLEQNAVTTAVRSTRQAEQAETEKGFALAPSAKDLNPWYSTKTLDNPEATDEKAKQKAKRDMARKSNHDPLTSITRQLASSSSTSTHRPPMPSQRRAAPTSELNARLSRESSERERAQALIRRKQRDMGSATPSTVHGGVDDAEYGDMYNRRAVEDAHRERRRDDGWSHRRH